MSVQEQALTLRESKLISIVSDTLQSDSPKSMKQCLISAGFAESTADKQAKVVIGKPRVANALQQAMLDAGINDKKLSEVMHDGINANKVISAIAGKDANGKTVDFVDVPDHPTRHKYMDTALKLRGEYPKEQTGITVQGDMNIQIVDYSKTIEVHEDKPDED